MRARSKKANTYAFIDSQNLNLGTQRMGWKMDWRKFREVLRAKYGVTQAYMFIGYMSENESLYEYMHELGFLVVLKPTLDVTASKEDKSEAKDHPASKDEAKEKEKPVVKGNVDAELVLYAMKELPHYSDAIIVSGDGDFFSLAEYLEEQGKLKNIMTPNWQYSSLLKPFEAKIIRLDQMRKELAYHDRKKKLKS
ncbi:MAG TPA: NYN domain-containing protein [Candidatus Saccharimonadales bacterium]|nr:NYN domain-containing protein [Candidatus Saccharimonadales bacterium]